MTHRNDEEDVPPRSWGKADGSVVAADKVTANMGQAPELVGALHHGLGLVGGGHSR